LNKENGMNQNGLQQGVKLTFYCHVRDKHDGMLLSEWLLEQAMKQGIGGGSVFRATACYGRKGVLHEEQFFELADNLTAKVEFLVSAEQSEAFLKRVCEAGANLVYAQSATAFGVIGKP
jgi:PII-like signaling protein